LVVYTEAETNLEGQLITVENGTLTCATEAPTSATNAARTSCATYGDGTDTDVFAAAISPNAGATTMTIRSYSKSSASSAAATAYNAKDRFPPISKDDAHKNLAVISLVAKNYLPVLFNAFEKCALGVGAITQAAPSTALASQLQIQQLPASVSNERSRKVLDAIVAYVSVSPKPLVTAMCDRLHKLLVAALSALSAQQDMVKAAIANLRAATAEDTRVRSKNEAARAKAAAAFNGFFLAPLASFFSGSYAG
jgi:Trk K+ transport system NAD-binding subunit